MVSKWRRIFRLVPTCCFPPSSMASLALSFGACAFGRRLGATLSVRRVTVWPQWPYDDDARPAKPVGDPQFRWPPKGAPEEPAASERLPDSRRDDFGTGEGAMKSLFWGQPQKELVNMNPHASLISTGSPIKYHGQVLVLFGWQKPRCLVFATAPAMAKGSEGQRRLGWMYVRPTLSLQIGRFRWNVSFSHLFQANCMEDDGVTEKKKRFFP